MVMTARTQRLPVVFIPEQLFITPMRDDMVNHRRRCDFAVSHAFSAQRIALQEAGAGFSPTAIITTGFCAAAPAVG